MRGSSASSDRARSEPARSGGVPTSAREAFRNERREWSSRVTLRALLPGCGRLPEGTLHLVLRIGGYRAVPPQPTHHIRQDRPAELLSVPVHPPGVVHVVALLGEGLHQPDVLVEPIPLLVVLAVAAHPAVVVPAIAQVHADRLLLARQHLLRVDVPAPQVDEAA